MVGGAAGVEEEVATEMTMGAVAGDSGTSTGMAGQVLVLRKRPFVLCTSCASRCVS